MIKPATSTAHINAVFTFFLSYGGSEDRPSKALAQPKRNSLTAFRQFANSIDINLELASVCRTEADSNNYDRPARSYGIRGAIWYQGESNDGEGMLYFEKMRALIGS
jgi:hypothetical protein